MTRIAIIGAGSTTFRTTPVGDILHGRRLTAIADRGAALAGADQVVEAGLAPGAVR